MGCGLGPFGYKILAVVDTCVVIFGRLWNLFVNLEVIGRLGVCNLEINFLGTGSSVTVFFPTKAL